MRQAGKDLSPGRICLGRECAYAIVREPLSTLLRNHVFVKMCPLSTSHPHGQRWFAGGSSVRVTFGRPWYRWRDVALGCGTGVGRAVARDQGVLGHGWAPEDPTGFGLQAVVMALLSLEKKGHVLLASMRVTVALVAQAQTMRAWCDPYGLHAQPPIERLGIKPEEMDRAWPHDQRIGFAVTITVLRAWCLRTAP